MAETVGFLLLSAASLEAAAGTVLFGTLTVGGAVGTAALLGASLAIAYATQPGVSLPRPSDGTQTMKQAIAPRPFGYGRARIAGAYVFFEVGSSGDTFSFDVIALHQGKIGSFENYYLHDDLVFLTGDQVRSVPGVGDNRYDIGGGNSNVIIQTRLGLDTETHYSAVTALIPSWTSAHRGDGIASAMLRCEQASNLQAQHETFPRGLPKFSAVCELSPIFDPRDGAQDREDPDTWTVSRNPVLQLLDYLTHADRGPALDWDTVIEPAIDALMAQADYCDELVTTWNGDTEPRYRSCGWAHLTTDPADVIAAILSTCDGWMAERGDGTLALIVGKYSAPTVTLTDDHIIGFAIDHGVADEDVVNELQWSYVAPGNDWRETPGTPWRDEVSIAELGVVRSENRALTWVQSHSQGRRLAKRIVARHQAALRGTLVCSLYGLQALGQRWLAVRSREIDDLTNAVIEVTRARIDIANGRVTFEWTLVNPNSIDAWDPATEEGLAPPLSGRIMLILPTPASVNATKVGLTISLAFTDNSADPDIVAYEVQYRITGSGDSAWVPQAFLTFTPSGGIITLVTNAVAAGNYDVRVACIGAEGVVGPWSATDTVTI